MTPDDAAKVLAVAATFDQRHRPPSEADADARSMAWAQALNSKMPTEFAIRAVVAHYKDHTESVMPAHLNERWRAQHRLDVERAQQRALQQQRGVPMPPEVRAQILAFTRKVES